MTVNPEGAKVASHYATGRAGEQIRAALTGAGKDPDRLEPYDLALLEDFHSSGRLATASLVELAAVMPEDRVLDAGCGIGGTARLLAHEVHCRVSAVDLTPEYCEIAAWLNHAVGLDPLIDVQQGDVLHLPFAPASFDVLFSQHVQMNVADKAGLYAEARRVLEPGGRLALWDVTAGPQRPLRFPVPWAETAELSHLVSSEDLRVLIESAGFDATVWNDLTDTTIEVMRRFNDGPRPPLGLHVFVPDFATKVANLLANLEQGRARLIQAVCVAR